LRASLNEVDATSGVVRRDLSMLSLPSVGRDCWLSVFRLASKFSFRIGTVSFEAKSTADTRGLSVRGLSVTFLLRADSSLEL